MLGNQDLATLTVRKIIFHDVPNSPRGNSSEPLLADVETKIDPPRKLMLTQRLVRALGSKSAYPVMFAPATSSPVPSEVQEFTKRKRKTPAQFVDMSRRLAQYLFDQQGGNVSPGLLCIIDVVSKGRAGMAVLKLERERGAELEVREEGGKRQFEMSVLDNLVFTDGTRLFKAALFLKVAANEFDVLVCDSQRTIATSSDIARFWMRFLGCQVLEDPRVATQKWFAVTVEFVNDHIDDPILKNDVYEHLVSELKSNRLSVSPKKFSEECLPDTYQRPYRDFLQEQRVSLTQFDKDVSDIQSKLRRRAFHTSKGVTVTEPITEQSLVEVASDQIVVHDQLLTIGK